MASGSGGSSTTAGYIEWAHEVAKPFEDRNIRSNHEHWGFDENKHAVVFKKFRDTFFSDRYICFLDLEFGPGLDYMLGKENDRPRYEKRDFGNKVISQTQAPVYTQLYYACARLVYENGDVRDLWFPWYSRTRYTGFGEPTLQYISQWTGKVFGHEIIKFWHLLGEHV